MRTTYEQVSIKGVRRWKENGKARQQTKTFWQTINPFNTNKNGDIKNRSEIMAELIADREVWLNAMPDQNSEGTK